VVDGLWYSAQPVVVSHFCGENTPWVRKLLCT
jgi:hypothetical protein